MGQWYLWLFLKYKVLHFYFMGRNKSGFTILLKRIGKLTSYYPKVTYEMVNLINKVQYELN